MKKAGASNRDKNRIRTMHKDGFSAEQISALTGVRVNHVQAITKRLEETGELLYTTGKSSATSKGGGLGHFKEGDVGEVLQIDQRAAELNVQQHKEEEAEALQRRLKEQSEELAKAKKALAEAKKPAKKAPAKKAAAKNGPKNKAAAGNEAA